METPGLAFTNKEQAMPTQKDKETKGPDSDVSPLTSVSTDMCVQCCYKYAWHIIGGPTHSSKASRIWGQHCVLLLVTKGELWGEDCDVRDPSCNGFFARVLLRVRQYTRYWGPSHKQNRHIFVLMKCCLRVSLNHNFKASWNDRCF